MTVVDHRGDAVARARAAEDEDFWVDLMPEAATLAVTAGHVSTRMLARKMRLGHALCEDLLKELHELGIVDSSEGDDAGTRQVLVEDLALALELVATDGGEEEDLDGDAEEGQPPDDETPAKVSLTKAPPTPDPPRIGELAIRPTSALALPDASTVARTEPLVVRVRQAAARATVLVIDQPVVERTLSVGRQAPAAGGRLVKWAPRGAHRVVTMAWGWATDSRTSTLLAKHADAGEGDQYAKVAGAKANVRGRQAALVAAAGLLTLLGLAWWAPTVFGGVLASLAFAAGVAVALQRRGKELLWGLALACGLTAVAWFKGPALAVLVPQPPEWAWWVAGGVAVVVCGLLGRQEDQHLVEMPQPRSDTTPGRPTASMVVDALCRIGVPGMTLAAAGRVHDEVRVRAPGVARSTRGYTIELELPPGVTAGDVMDKREELAGALRRKLGCVWPSRGTDHPGHLRLFLSDIPMATAPQPTWPLAVGQPIDVFDPLPLVTDQEGEWVDLDVTSTHTVIAGASGFGKSVTLRHLAVALTFDPRARLYVFDGKISGDLDPVRKIAHAYYEGADEDDVAEQLDALRGLEKEMRRRARFLRDLPVEERSPKVTSALATKYPHLSPIFALFDECQEYTEYGTKGVKEEMAIRTQFRTIITRISRLGRSAGIFLVLVSQKPDADVLPTAIMGNCSNRLCFKVTEQNHNDQVLGTGAYKAGLKATLFSTDDRGLAWLKAAGDPQVVRGWSEMVDLQAGYDLADIAYRMRKARNLLTGQAADDGIEDAEVVYDVVQDAEQVMSSRGCGKAQWGELVAMLQELRPGQYGELTEKVLSASIYKTGIEPRDVRSGMHVRKGVYISDLRKLGTDDDE